MVVQTLAFSDILDTDKQCAPRTSNCPECHGLQVRDVEIHSENAVPQHFIISMPVGNVDIPKTGNFHMIYRTNLFLLFFVQGSLIGGSCVILVPFWPRQLYEFGSRE